VKLPFFPEPVTIVLSILCLSMPQILRYSYIISLFAHYQSLHS